MRCYQNVVIALVTYVTFVVEVNFDDDVGLGVSVDIYRYMAPLVPVLSQMHPVHIFPPSFLKTHSNITLPSTHRSSEWAVPFWFPDQILYAFLISPCLLQAPSLSFSLI
jgi:hypothetical protein